MGSTLAEVLQEYNQLLQTEAQQRDAEVQARANSTPPSPNTQIPSTRIPGGGPAPDTLDPDATTSAFYKDWLDKYNFEDELNKVNELITSGVIPYTRPNENLGKLSFEEAANDMNHQATLAYSRLADALNNRYYRTPQRVSRAHSGTEGSLDDIPEWRAPYQMKGETEEMRAQERARQYEATATGRRIARSESSKDLALKLRELQQLEQLRRNGQISDEQLRRYTTLYDELFRQTYKAQFDEQLRRSAEAFNQFTSRIAIPNEQASILWSWFAKNQSFGKLLAPLFGGTTLPAAQQYAFDARMQQAISNYNNGSTTAAEFNRETANALIETLAATTGESVESIKEAWPGLFESFAGGR